MMDASLCTYRVTRGGHKPKGTRIVCRHEMHCQHYRKPPTAKQIQHGAAAKAKKEKKPLCAQVRNKKTQCPSKLILALQVPTLKQKVSSEHNPYLLSHKAVLKLSFTHNHPIAAAHSLSFRPVIESTKNDFFELFDKGHCASSARHTHEQKLILNSETDAEKQTMLADRAKNPNVQDICRLFVEWRIKNYGKEDGTEMFKMLRHEVDLYNEKNQSLGGKALLQWYVRNNCDNESGSSGSDCEEIPRPKKKKQEIPQKPMILAIVTPLMARAHQHIQQASEIVFCDSTASLDRFNTSVFIISTSTTASGVPLAVILTSDEREQTIYAAFELVKQILTTSAFFGRGPDCGPQIFMIDDSISERSAIERAWPNAQVLLCTFHFLQRRWTWLYDGKNKIGKNERLTFIKKIQNMVYGQTESAIESYYNELLKLPEATKYKHFIEHVRSVWDKRHAWAHCYRVNLPTRGNHTNNYAEAGIRILKEIIFS